MPPWSWPSTSSGLRMRAGVVDGDDAARAATWPVSVSTSTTATWAPNGNVGAPGLKSSSIASSPGGRRRRARRRARPTTWPTAGVPATWKRPRSVVEHDVGGGRPRAASAASSLPARRPRSAALVTAAPPCCSEREPSCRAARDEVGVAVTTVDRRPSGCRAVARRASTTRSAWPWPCGEVPVCTVAPPSAVTSTSPYSRLGDAVRDLDVDAQADAELARVAAPRGGAACSARSVVRSPAASSARSSALLVVAAVVARRRWRVVYGNASARDQVPAAHLGRVHADLGGEQVDRALDRRRRLGRPAPR